MIQLVGEDGCFRDGDGDGFRNGSVTEDEWYPTISLIGNLEVNNQQNNQ